MKPGIQALKQRNGLNPASDSKYDDALAVMRNQERYHGTIERSYFRAFETLRVRILSEAVTLDGAVVRPPSVTQELAVWGQATTAQRVSEIAAMSGERAKTKPSGQTALLHHKNLTAS
jgi:hypothetical protein